MTIETVTATDLRRHAADLLDRVAAGETIVIERHGTPVAELVPRRAAGASLLGRFNGMFVTTVPDDELIAPIPDWGPEHRD